MASISLISRDKYDTNGYRLSNTSHIPVTMLEYLIWYSPWFYAILIVIIPIHT